MMKIGFFPLIRNVFATLLCFLSCAYIAHAEEDYAAEGERRAKIAGQSLIGSAAPQLKVTTIEGKTIDLANVYGKKPVYLKFWATWCVPCRQQMPSFEDIYQKYGEQVQIIAINTGISDNLESVTAFKEKMGITMPIAIDNGQLSKAFNIRVTPQHLLIDINGKFAYFGHKDDEVFHQALTNVIKEKATTIASNPTLSLNQAGYQVGSEVDKLLLTTIDNETVTLHFNMPASKKVGLVFFSPWCEWYLEESLPNASKACTQVRERLEKASKTSTTQWLTISTHLWASIAELQDYRKNYHTSLPIVFDNENELFNQFNVNQLPTIIVIEANGKISLKSSLQDNDFDTALRTISAL